MIFEIVDFYHRKKKTFIAIMIIIALSIIAIVLSLCFKRYNYPQELVEIDSICNVNPTEASDKLKTYHTKASYIHGETKWFFRFLTLKSKIKANIKVSNDNEVKALISHYENNGDKSLLPEVYYCAGCAYNSLMDIPQANFYFFKGIRLLAKSNDKKLLALYYYQLGQNFSMQELHKEAFYWESKSLAINKEMKDTTRFIYDYMNLAWTLGNLGNPGKALKTMLKARETAKSIDDENLLSEIDCQIANHCLELGMTNKAKTHIDWAIKEKNFGNSTLYATALDTYMRLGDIDKINEYSDSVMRHGNVYGKRYVYWCLIERSMKESDLHHVAEYLKYYKVYDDSAKKISAAEASAKANALYNYKLREKENQQLQEENSDKNFFVSTSAAALIICILSSYIIYIKIKQQKRLTEKRCEILTEQLKEVRETSNASIQEKEQEIIAIKKQILENKDEGINATLDAKQAELNEISNRKKAIDKCIEDVKSTEVYKQISNILKGYDNAAFSRWEDLEKAIYECFPNFETKLRNIGYMNTTESRVCHLIRMGLSVKDISDIICMSKSTIYSINQRLFYKKFGRYAPSSDWIEFIRTIY